MALISASPILPCLTSMSLAVTGIESDSIWHGPRFYLAESDSNWHMGLAERDSNWPSRER